LGERGALQVWRNGSAAATLARKDNFNSSATAQAMQLSGSTALWCDAGDTLDVRISQNSGSTIALMANPTDVYVNIARIA